LYNCPDFGSCRVKETRSAATKLLYSELYGAPARERLQTIINEAKSSDPLAPVTVVVPSQYAGIATRRILGLKKGLVNVRFMVFPRLMEYLGSPSLAAKGKTPLSPLLELAAVQYSQAAVKNKGPLTDVADHPNLHLSLVRTFRELDRLSADGLKHMASIDPLRKQVVAWYWESRRLVEDYYTAETLALSAAEAITSGAASSVLKDLGFIVIYLVPDFSPSEFRLMQNLLDSGRAALMSGMTGEREVDSILFATLKRFAPALEISGPTAPNYLIEHIAIAHNAREEVKWIVRRIMKQAESGTPFHRMAVLYHDAFPYSRLIPTQLALSEVPVAGPSSVQLKNTPPGKLITHFLNVIAGDFAREDIMSWVAESPVKACPYGIPAQPELARWEIISQNAGVVKGAAHWRERLTAYRKHLDNEISSVPSADEIDTAQLNGLKQQRESLDVLSGFVRELAGISVPPDGSPFGTFSKWLIKLAEKYAYEPAGWPDEGKKALERILSLVSGLETIDDLFKTGTTFTDFKRFVEDALEATSGRTGATGEGVFVAPIPAAAGMDFETVYIVGMSEGAFPPHPLIDALLPDAVRAGMPPGDELPLAGQARIKARREFLAALAAGEKRVLSFCRTDTAAERGQYPSPWFLHEMEVLNGQPVTADGMDKLPVRPWLSTILSAEHALKYVRSLAPADTHDYDMAGLNRWRDKKHPEHYFLLEETTTAGRAIKMEKARNGNDFSVWDGNLTSTAGKSRRVGLPLDRHFSPTRLEKWAACPFSYFLGHVLEIPVYEKPEEILTIQPRERGSLVHGILERFMSTLIAFGGLPDYGAPWKSTDESLLLNIAREEFERFEKSGATGHPLTWLMTREDIEQDLLDFLRADNELRKDRGLKPLKVELGFGLAQKGSLPPVILNINGKEIKLSGFIDRVDATADGQNIYVIDYKTGGAGSYNAMKNDPLEAGKRLQLPVYAMAARNSFNKTADITAAYWFISTKGNFEKREVPLSEVETRFLEIIGLVVKGIEGCLFPANPDEGDGCRNCDYARICSSDRDIIWERKSKAPELRPYLELIGGQEEEAGDD
jgi:ATP-dependent helicase/nuclease subunit B